MNNPFSAARLPPGLTRVLSRYAIPLTVLVAVLLLGSAVAVTAVLAPNGLPFGGTRVSQTAELPETLQSGFIDEKDEDKDGLGDSFENYVYGTDPANWDSSGTGIPDGWLVRVGFDPLSPATRSARGATPAPATLPEAYGGQWPSHFRLPLKAYYEVGKPSDYVPGTTDPWWVGKPYPNPLQAVAPSGIPTSWLVFYGLDSNDATIADKVAAGSNGTLTVREAFTFNTHPLKVDSDGDGLADVDEIRIHKTDPSKFSSSDSGIADGWAVHYGLDPLSQGLAAEDSDSDGLTNLEEFVASYDDFRTEIEGDSVAVIFGRGLDPLNWQTSGSGIPDGWYVTYGLDAYGPAEKDRELQRASAFNAVRWLNAGPGSEEPLADVVLTVDGAYRHGRPASWNEEIDGVWWGGTNPSALDSDGDGLPDAVEIRGWYVNVTYGLGPQAGAQWVLVFGSPTDPDSDADGLSDLEEYRGVAQCKADDRREFKITDPRNKDTAFSGLTDREKVCGVVRGAFTYDFAATTGKGLDPTRADSAGDYLRDGAKVQYWHERFARYLRDTSYEFKNSSFPDVTSWTSKYARFAGMAPSEVVQTFRPDGDVDGDGVVNVLDPDPSGGLVDTKNPQVVLLPQGLQIDPTLYRFSEFRSSFPREATDPANPDTDGDELPDWWEVKWGAYAPAVGGWNLDPSKFASLGDGVSDAKRNDDGDIIQWSGYRTASNGDRVRVATGLDKQPFDYNNLQEFVYGTNPNQRSTVGDGVSDGWKVFWGLLYPTLVAQNAAGELTNAQEDEVRVGGGRIGPLLDLKDKGHPDKRQGYARFVNVTSCSDLNEPFLRTSSAIATHERLAVKERLDMNTASGTIPCPIQTLVGANQPVARVVGEFVYTYEREEAFGTNPYLVDSDGDGAPDAYEVCMMRPATATPVSDRTPRGCGGFALPLTGATRPNPILPDGKIDHDGDGSDLVAECGFDAGTKQCTVAGLADGAGGSDPNLGDTDRDGVDDGLEIPAGLNPLNPTDVARFKSRVDTDRDGVLDFQELTGHGKAYYGTLVRTDPGDADSDRIGCPGTDAVWQGDNLLDGDVVRLQHATDAGLITAWRNRGIAWFNNSGEITFLGEVTESHPRHGDSVCDGIPDGWRTYYLTRGFSARPLKDKDTDNLENYEKGRPDWWQESVHTAWWWGAPPAGLDDKDLDNDALLDAAGEDPFPTLAGNRYVYGAFSTTDPAQAATFIKDAPTPAEARLRAQAFGDGAGNPIEARNAAANEAAKPANFPARTRLVDVVVNAPVGTDSRHELQKGVTFTVTGRLVIDEVGSPDNGKGVPSATVLVSALEADPDAVLGAAFTDATGAFSVAANITQARSITAPPGHILLGRTGGPVDWSVPSTALDVGTLTRGESNTVTVWTYRSPNAPDAASPYANYNFTKIGGAKASAIDRAPPVSRSVLVTSGTSTAFALESPALNGDILRGTARLTDASGAPLGDRNVTLRWFGAGSAPFVLGESNVKVRTDSDGYVNLTNLRIPVGTTEPGSYRLIAAFYPAAADPFLRVGISEMRVPVRTPVTLTAAALATNLAIGGEFVVEGTLRTVGYTVPGGAPVPAAAAPGETLRLTLGNLVVATTTDPSGRYSARLVVPADLPSGANVVRVVFDGSARLHKSAPEEVAVTVKRSTALTGLREQAAPRGGELVVGGTLVDLGGDGIEGQSVSVLVDGRSIARSTTNKGGGFAAKGLVPRDTALGTTTLTVLFGGSADFAATSNTTALRVFSATRLVIDEVTAPVLRGAPFVIEGRLLDAAARGVPRGAVELYWAGEQKTHAITEPDGSFRATYDVPPLERLGPVQVGLLYAPNDASVYRGASFAKEHLVRAAVDLTLEEQVVRRGLVTATGRMLDDRGNAMPGQAVRLTWNGADVGTARTVRNGSFSVPYVVPSSHPAGAIDVTAVFNPGADARFANARAEATFLLRGVPTFTIAESSGVVRGEELELKGTFIEDNGAGLSVRFNVSLGGTLLGTARAERGAFTFAAVVPTTLASGPATLTLSHDGTEFLESSRLDIPVTIKLRPQVSVDLPKLAVQGRAFTGDVTLLDDLGAPLRNRTFVYRVAGEGQAVTGTTDADGKATVSGVARPTDTFIALAVKGSDDVLPTEIRTAAVTVVGAGTSAGIGLLAVIIVLVVIAGIVALVYAYYRRRQLKEVRDIIEQAIDELIAGNEYVGTIFLAYKRLSAHLATYGFIEKEEDTAREFAGAVHRALPLTPQALRTLIRLFEEAKYSDHAVGLGERDRAIEALGRVRTELDDVLGNGPLTPTPEGVTPT